MALFWVAPIKLWVFLIETTILEIICGFQFLKLYANHLKLHIWIWKYNTSPVLKTTIFMIPWVEDGLKW